jgi:hypothetical protein
MSLSRSVAGDVLHRLDLGAAEHAEDALLALRQLRPGLDGSPPSRSTQRRNTLMVRPWAKTLNATNYWWSNPVNVTLTSNGTFSLTATIAPTGANWSDYFGATGNQDQSTTSAFDAAASDVKDIGFSFGGGYFFSNGVGTTDGSGTFTETSFTVIQGRGATRMDSRVRTGFAAASSSSIQTFRSLRSPRTSVLIAN